jgi:hypothetical protein
MTRGVATALVALLMLLAGSPVAAQVPGAVAAVPPETAGSEGTRAARVPDAQVVSGPAAQPSPRKLDTRTQYPDWLANSTFGINLGYIDYPFSQAQLQPGFQARSIQIPKAAGSIVLMGREFTRHLSGQASYLRAAKFVRYDDINRRQSSDSVWVVSATFTLRARVPVSSRVSITGEAGLGVTNRRGFTHNDVAVVKDAHVAALVLGTGAEYRLGRAWDAIAAVTYLSGRARYEQPRTLFMSSGIRYTLRPLPASRVRAPADDGPIFPEQLVRLEYTHAAFGFGVNRLLSSKVPIFWGGHVEVGRGGALRYERNIFHTRRFVSVDLGASIAHWRSLEKDEAFTTVSLYPLLRFTLVRSRAADLFVSYSVAGPTFISGKMIDDQEVGTTRFTFQDALGVGAFVGANRRGMVGLCISHYSNGNLFSRNAGIAIPLTVSFGYSF